MLPLGNSTCRLKPKYRCLLYRACVIPIATYSCRLWNYKGAHIKGPLNNLQHMQCHTGLWITGTFHTSPTGSVKALAGLPPIHLHTCILVERSYVQTQALDPLDAFWTLVDGNHRYSQGGARIMIRDTQQVGRFGCQA
jgi:hypothetical protein